MTKLFHLKFPWRRKSDKKEEPTLKETAKEDIESQKTEQITEDGSVRFEPDVHIEQSPTVNNKERVTELLTKQGMPTMIRAGQDIQISAGKKEEISNLIQESKIKPSEDENLVTKIANFYYFAGRPQESLELYDSILKQSPTKVSVLNNKGIVLDSLERYDDALACFDKALATAPENVHVLSNKGIMLYKKGMYSEALVSLEISLKFDPRYLEALICKANVLYKQGKRSAALEVYNTALKIEPTNAELHYNKACISSIEGRESDALFSLEKAISMDPVWKETAAKDKDFDRMHNIARFRELVGQKF